jgi:hypothetical protein
MKVITLPGRAPAAFLLVCLARGLAGGATWAAAPVLPPAQRLIYSTSFEATETPPFVVGDLRGQGPWVVAEGSARVQSAIASSGAQGVEFSRSRFAFGLAAAEPVLWVDAWFWEPGSTNAPMLPTGAASAAIFFSATRGILALDGDGAGRGVFVTVASELPTDRYVRLSVRLDFHLQRYAVWVDGVRRRDGLGFLNQSVRSFAGLEHQAGNVGRLDYFSLSTWGVDQDGDRDGLPDLDEAKFGASDPLRRDTDGDGADDGHERLAGTDARDARSVFGLGISRPEAGRLVLALPTVPGRQYALERRRVMGLGAREELPGATAIPGDGTVKLFPATEDLPMSLFRAKVSP